MGLGDWRRPRGRVGRDHTCAEGSFADCRELGQRSGQGQDVARVGGFQSDPAEQALQVENAIECAAEFFAGDGFFYLSLDSVQTGVDLRDVDRRAQQPGAQEALAHGRDRGVNRAEQGDAGVGAGEERFDQFQIAHGDCIEHQAGLAFVESDAIDVT